MWTNVIESELRNCDLISNSAPFPASDQRIKSTLRSIKSTNQVATLRTNVAKNVKKKRNRIFIPCYEFFFSNISYKKILLENYLYIVNMMRIRFYLIDVCHLQ